MHTGNQSAPIWKHVCCTTASGKWNCLFFLLCCCSSSSRNTLMNKVIMAGNYSTELQHWMRLWFKCLSVNETPVFSIHLPHCTCPSYAWSQLSIINYFTLRSLIAYLCFPMIPYSPLINMKNLLEPMMRTNNITKHTFICVFPHKGDRWRAAVTEWLTCTHTCTHAHTQKLLTVMYLTSMSVFRSSSVIISLWNLLNFRWGGGGDKREEMGRRHTGDY